MSARPVLAACAIAAVLGGACADSEEQEPAGARPRHLLLLTLDTVRADALGAYGQQLPSSPELDRLAREGVVFEQASSASPLTLPSHSTILTGLLPFSHGVRANSEYALSPETRTLAEELQQHGYRTGAEVSAPVLNNARGLARGFESYRDLNSAGVARVRLPGSTDGVQGRRLPERPADDVTRFGKRFLAEDDGRPFFLWLHYFDAHLPHVAPKDFAEQLPGAPYLAEIRFVDAQIGQLIRQLEALGLRDQTLVVIVADHGEGRGNHGEAAHGFFVYETTMRVPLILWGPSSLPAGQRISAPVRTVDITPTLLELLGHPPLEGAQGTSLASLLAGGSPDPGLLAYGESIEAALVFGSSPLRFVRRGSWKYVHQLEPLLFDLDGDPRERHNRASDEPERVAELRSELGRLLAGGQRTNASSRLDRKQAERLRALGYLSSGRLSDGSLASLELQGPSPSSLADDIDRLARAGALARGGQPELAEPVYREFVAQHPESPALRRDLAQSLSAMGRLEEARGVLEALLELAPCDAAARVELARLLGELRDLGSQLEILRGGVGTCSESDALLNHFAFALATNPRAELRDGEEAVRAARRALELGGEDRPMLLDTLAAAHAEAGNFPEALRVADRAIAVAEQQHRSPELLASLRRSRASFEQGHPLRIE